MTRTLNSAREPKRRLRNVIPDATDRRHLHVAFLTDIVTACRSLPGIALRVAHTPDGDAASFHALGLSDNELLLQRGNNLGAREQNVFMDLFKGGFSKVVMIGSDLPTLPPLHLIEAFKQIEVLSVVLGPATDGGYYLIGLRKPPKHGRIPDLFSQVRWSTADTLVDTVRVALSGGLAVKYVTPWYDVDTKDDLAKLRRDLRSPVHALRAPETTSTLKRLFDRQKT